jgi:hypothetical protein
MDRIARSVVWLILIGVVVGIFTLIAAAVATVLIYALSLLE